MMDHPPCRVKDAEILTSIPNSPGALQNVPAVAVSTRLLINVSLLKSAISSPLTSESKKARFKKGFMDEKENTMLQGLQSQGENWGWMLIKHCSKNWAERICPCQGGDERKQTRRKDDMGLTCFVPQAHKIGPWLQGPCLKHPSRENPKWGLWKHRSASRFLLLTVRPGPSL